MKTWQSRGFSLSEKILDASAESNISKDGKNYNKNNSELKEIDFPYINARSLKK